jgi:8-oxo-dGTP pyrophosphatase MutT (NUDIX family)
MMKDEKANKEKIRVVMREFKDGELEDSHGNKVTDRKQALAIALSEAEQLEKAFIKKEKEAYVCLLAVDEQNRVLLLRRGLTAPWQPLRWSLPGGKVEVGELPFFALMREVKEEMNVDLRPEYLEIFSIVEHDNLFGYYYWYNCPDMYCFDTTVLNFENDRLLWVEEDQLGTYDLITGLKEKIDLFVFTLNNFGDLLNIEKSFDDYPLQAVNNAKKALKWKKEHGDEVSAGTSVGWARARQLANKESLSLDVVARMAQFNRHRGNAKIDEKYKDEPWKDNGYVAWLLWGGTAGVDWASKKYEKEKGKNKVEKAFDSMFK